MALYSVRFRRSLLSLSSSLLHRNLHFQSSRRISCLSSNLQADAQKIKKPTISHLQWFRSFVSYPESLSPQWQYQRQNDDNDQQQIRPDYNHWLITIDFPKGKNITDEEKRGTYLRTAAQVFGSEEEAKKRIYACNSCSFQVECSEETSARFEGLPGVVFIIPDSDIHLVKKENGGDKNDNGIITCRPPPTQYLQSNQVSRNSDRPPRENYSSYQGPPTQQNYGPPQPRPTQPNYGLLQSSPTPQSYGSPQCPPSPHQQSHGLPQGPPSQQNHGLPWGPASQQNYGPPSWVSPTQQNYGPPPQGPPSQQNHGMPWDSASQQNYGPPSWVPPSQQNYGPPPGLPWGPASQQNYGPPSCVPPLQQNYGPQPQGPPSQQYHGLPWAPAWQHSQQNYGPPSWLLPSQQNYVPPPQGPSQQNHGLPWGPASQQNYGPPSWVQPSQINYGPPPPAPPSQQHYVPPPQVPFSQQQYGPPPQAPTSQQNYNPPPQGHHSQQYYRPSPPQGPQSQQLYRPPPPQGPPLQQNFGLHSSAPQPINERPLRQPNYSMQRAPAQQNYSHTQDLPHQQNFGRQQNDLKQNVPLITSGSWDRLDGGRRDFPRVDDGYPGPRHFEGQGQSSRSTQGGNFNPGLDVTPREDAKNYASLNLNIDERFSV